MTLKNSQVERLFTYLNAEYQKKLQDLESTRIKEIEESDEYKPTFTEIKSFLISKGLGEEDATHRTSVICETIFNTNEIIYNTWSNRMIIERKLEAILSTLPDSLSFEEVVKLVDEKLEFEQIINKQ
jgi:hypothetical protein